MSGAIPPLPKYAFMAWCLVKAQGQLYLFTFNFYIGGSSTGWGAGNFSLHQCVQTGPGAHPASYPMGIGGSFPGGKTAGV
jgi:hypothetical protein